jgi:solute carrier family 6 amino acid transporter-like protein 5/7/9/14
MNNILTNLKDFFPNLKVWLIATICAVVGYSMGLVNTTEGGIYVLELVDEFGGQFIIFALATNEIICIAWVYGLQNICWDVEFMLGRKLSSYWRVCWAVVMPLFMLTNFGIFSFKIRENRSLNQLPSAVLGVGWSLFAFGMLQIFICIAYHYMMRSTEGDVKIGSFMKYLTTLNENWGPKNPNTKREWLNFKAEKLRLHNLDI